MEFLFGVILGAMVGYMFGFTNGYNTFLRQLKSYAKAKKVTDLYPEDKK